MSSSIYIDLMLIVTKPFQFDCSFLIIVTLCRLHMVYIARWFFCISTELHLSLKYFAHVLAEDSLFLLLNDLVPTYSEAVSLS
jgi:hypothetical protein